MGVVEDLPDQHGSRWHVPFLAQIAGVKHESVYYSPEVGSVGRKSLKLRGLYKLVVPGCLAVISSFAGYMVIGVAGLCFGLLFFMTGTWIQSIVNPLISEKRALHQRTVLPALFAYVVMLVSGTFAATMLAWYLFQTTVDQRHHENVANVMSLSQERKDVTFSEGALEKERTYQLTKQQVNTSGIDRAAQAYTRAQETAAQASAAHREEIAKGQGGRKAGKGPAADSLWQALQVAIAAETSAKLALEQARQQASVTISVPEHLVAAYNNAKGRYEAKERSLIEAGPGMINTFWWLIGMMHTQPLLIVFIFGWAGLEASGVITHAYAGHSVYERERLNAEKFDVEVRREAQRIVEERVRERGAHEAAMRVARKDAKVVNLEARDKAKRR